jgi:SAM-dependent methyltransferase
VTGSDTSPTEIDGFEGWLARTVARHAPPLVFAEVRKGVQALSMLYVERRHERGPDGPARLGSRATDGEGKRAALATFYAPLHLLVAHAAARAHLAHGDGPAPRRIVDLGCGTGAAGAGVARALAPRPEILAIDASGWALGEARHTHRDLGLAGRTRRGALPAALPRTDARDLLVCGWFLNELDAGAREAVLGGIDAALAAGSGLLVLEPLARGITPWWDAVARRLSPHGVAAAEIKIEPALPDWVARLDAAAGLDHGQIGARVLFRAPVASAMRKRGGTR